MTADQLFVILNNLALVSWIALAGLPRVRWVAHALTALWIPLVFAGVYVAIVATVFWSSEGSFTSLAGVQRLFQDPWLLLAGWTHYLAFDLLVGTWELRDAQKRQLPHLLVVPCLFLTLMFGPAGWLAYRGVRLAYGRRASV